MKITYISFLSKDIEDYIEFKCSLGYSSSTYDAVLGRFDAFCSDGYPFGTTVTEEIVSAWIKKTPTENTNGHIRRMIALKGFLSFLSLRQPETYQIPDGVIGQYKPYLPYLYSNDELDAFFLAADTMPEHPVAKNREIITPVIFRMLFCCGLRPPEPLMLRRADVDLKSGTIYIADSKVHKDRIVPMAEDICSLCQKFDSILNDRLPDRDYFFQRPDGKHYDVMWLQRTFRACLKHSRLSFHDRSPRVYDFRHNFATHVIRRWIRSEIDVGNMLPRLSTYMGHTSLEDTAYYIHLVPEHFETNQLNEWSCIPEVPAYED